MRTQPERGVSLLEVLVSIAVIAIGLFGVAALLPVARFTVVETGKADRSAALGRAAMAEVKARGLLQPVDRRTSRVLWWWPDYAPAADVNISGVVWAIHPSLVGQSVVIDPLFVTRYRIDDPSLGSVNQVACFPYTDTAKGSYPLPRLTVNALGLADAAFLSLSDANKDLVYRRIFAGGDDLIFSTESDPDRRPGAERLWSNGAVATTAPTPGTVTPVIDQSEGNYSWLLTLVPSPGETPPVVAATGEANALALAADHQRTYNVSIVVFYKRDLAFEPAADVPSERWADVTFTGGGYGGGDVVLTATGTNEYLAVRPGQWIMVYGATPDPRLLSARRIAQWYRVVSVDDVEQLTSTTFQRRVTLDGPDWNTGLTWVTLRTALVDGVIGVYTKTIRLDDGTTWD